MAFNPSPKVADARKIAGEWDKEQSNEAKRLGDICFDAIMKHFES